MTHVCAWAGQNCQGFMQIVNSVALAKVKIRERVAKVAAKVSAKFNCRKTSAKAKPPSKCSHCQSFAKAEKRAGALAKAKT
jgi:hypothetical protein